MSRIAQSVIVALFMLFASAVHAGNKLEIAVTLSPAGSFKATTSAVNGFAFKTDNGVSAKDVKIDLRSLKTGVSLRDKHTKKYLRVDKFPEAKLVQASGQNGKGKAVISVAGLERAVEGTYSVRGDVLRAEFPMQLSDLDINDVSYMGVGVKDTVKVSIEVPLQEAPPAAGKKAKRD